MEKGHELAAGLASGSKVQKIPTPRKSSKCALAQTKEAARSRSNEHGALTTVVQPDCVRGQGTSYHSGLNKRYDTVNPQFSCVLVGCHLRRKVFEFAVSHAPHNPKVRMKKDHKTSPPGTREDTSTPWFRARNLAKGTPATRAA